MKKTATQKSQRITRHKRIRKKVVGTTQRPRLFVFKSNKHIYAGIADDVAGKVLFSLSDVQKKSTTKAKTTKTKKKQETKTDQAKGVGERVAKTAMEKGIKKVVFDRGGYRYHGRIKALAEGARLSGLIF
ncbi:MAG: 50S ribosomal protein L18 [Candidatus Spechtbacteria bacterium SB0662_bin_43]|uniref:Large ribosomal subunit protein uL18 n=1 Tax=Candidatus Spechtbacteria bacterium SB0662_bin_43 TaxID=2604897 RepID=A0A845DJX4_9BACT|nr:50S ribosomal protein L18 [Candidatus Spechtbacteria bacterium SB0662_bin_43]